MGKEIEKKPVRVLQVTIGDGSYGGVASFMYSYYSHMDHENVHFDFLYCGENSMQSKEKSSVLKDSKITIFHVIKPQDNGPKEYKELIRKLKEFFGKNQYDIVHANTSNVMVSMCVAYALAGRAVYIAHSHNTKAVANNQSKIKENIKDILKGQARKYVLRKADYYFACSKAAGENMFGKKALMSEKFRVINNAIELSSYVYNPIMRKKYRNTNKTVFGYVGRLTAQKNPFFLLDVFFEIHKNNPNSELWMVGEGELLDSVQRKIRDLDLGSSVILLGRRNDVACLMQAMDVFLLPSLFEGLSIVAVEAQAAGLPIYASDSISVEHKVTNLVRFLPLSAGAKNWAKIIGNEISKLPERKNMLLDMSKAGYEIRTQSKWLEEFYCSNGKMKMNRR